MEEVLWAVAVASALCSAGDNCQVKDPRHGNLYDLRPLGLHDTVVSAGEYNYHFRVCGRLSADVCPTPDRSRVVSSCQEKQGPEGFHKVAGTTRFPVTGLAGPAESRRALGCRGQDWNARLSRWGPVSLEEEERVFCCSSVGVAC